jgi:hypothetical protein
MAAHLTNGGGSMKSTFCSVIVLTNDAPRIVKLRVSRFVIAILAAAGFVSLLVTVLLGYYFPPSRFNEFDPSHLRGENYALRLQNQNTELQTQKLSSELSELEKRSNRIVGLIEAE